MSKYNHIQKYITSCANESCPLSSQAVQYEREYHDVHVLSNLAKMLPVSIARPSPNHDLPNLIFLQ